MTEVKTHIYYKIKSSLIEDNYIFDKYLSFIVNFPLHDSIDPIYDDVRDNLKKYQKLKVTT